MRLDKHLGGENKTATLSDILEKGKESEVAVNVSKNVSKILPYLIDAIVSSSESIYDVSTFYYQVYAALSDQGYKNKLDMDTIQEIINNSMTQIIGSCKDVLFFRGQNADSIRGIVASVLINLSKDKKIELKDASNFDHLGSFLEKGKTLIIHGGVGPYAGYRSHKGSTIISENADDYYGSEAEGRFIAKHAGEYLGYEAKHACKIYVISADRFAASYSDASFYLFSAKPYVGAGSAYDCTINVVNCHKMRNTDAGKSKIKIISEKNLKDTFRKVGLFLENK